MFEHLIGSYRQLVEKIQEKYVAPHSVNIYNSKEHKRISEQFETELSHCALLWIGDLLFELPDSEVDELIAAVNSIIREKIKTFNTRLKPTKYIFPPFNEFHLN